MTRCLVALGSNVGDRAERLAAAVRALAKLDSTMLTAQSEWRETIPVGGPPGQQPFLNGAVTIESTLAPAQLLAEFQAIQRQADRTPGERWAARTLDVDLLLYGDLVRATAELRVPHPRMTFRPFVLSPAVEIAGEWRHPQLDATLAKLQKTLAQGADRLVIRGELNNRNSVLSFLLNQSSNLRVERTADSEVASLWVRTSDQATGEEHRSAPPKLQILADSTAIPQPATPALWLEAAPAECLASELAAAMECVWPGLG